MSEWIFLSTPSIRGQEWKYVKDCLDTEWVSSAGRYVEKFEKEICGFTGAKHGVACVNGTAALDAALRLIGVGEGDEVLVPTLTFVATVNAVRYTGARPVFMDCDRFYNLDPEKTLEFLKRETKIKKGAVYNKKTGRRLAAVMPVHVFGNAANLQEVVSFCRHRNIKIIEDSTESLGSFYRAGEFKGVHTGLIGDIGCLSFNGNKIITTGGGGMILTNEENYARRGRYLTTQAKDDEVRFIHNEVGFNYRLTNLQAALGVGQMEKLPDFLRVKRENYLLYKKEIVKIPGLVLAEVPDYADNNYWMYALQIDKKIYGEDREALMHRLNGKMIQTRPVWFLNHLQKPYRSCQSYRIENAVRLWEKTLNLPCSVHLTKAQIRKVIQALKHE
jgi:perosamine synthetase